MTIYDFKKRFEARWTNPEGMDMNWSVKFGYHTDGAYPWKEYTGNINDTLTRWKTKSLKLPENGTYLYGITFYDNNGKVFVIDDSDIELESLMYLIGNCLGTQISRIKL